MRQLADELLHPHWIEFAKMLERENAELRADGICRRRGIPTKEESIRIKNLYADCERLWKDIVALKDQNAALKAQCRVAWESQEFYKAESIALGKDKERLDFLQSFYGSQWAHDYLHGHARLNRVDIDAHIATEAPNADWRKEAP